MSTLTPDETILGLLAIQARHGYDLLACFQNVAQLGEVWHLSASQLYAVLKRLERDAKITGVKIESENAPARTEYRLTAIGHSHLMAWLHESSPSASIRRIRVEFLSRLYIARQLKIPLASLIEAQQQACEKQRNFLMEQHAHAQSGIQTLAIELVIAQLDTVLQWLKNCETIS